MNFKFSSGGRWLKVSVLDRCALRSFNFPKLLSVFVVIDMCGPSRIDLSMIGKVCEKDLQSLNIFPRMFLNAVITFRHSPRMQFIAGRKNSYTPCCAYIEKR